MVVGWFVLYYNKHVGIRYCLPDSRPPMLLSYPRLRPGLLLLRSVLSSRQILLIRSIRWIRVPFHRLVFFLNTNNSNLFRSVSPRGSIRLLFQFAKSLVEGNGKFGEGSLGLSRCITWIGIGILHCHFLTVLTLGDEHAQ